MEHRSPYWCFTLHQDEKPDFKTDQVQYLVFQQEECPLTKKKHWQGYIEFKNRKRFNQVKDFLGNEAHIEPRRGTSQQAADYCKKPETAIAGTQHEEGTRSIPDQNGLEAVKRLIDEGKDMTEVAEEHFGQWCRYRKSFEAYQEIKRRTVIPQGFQPVEVEVHWGAPGTGKTRLVEDTAAAFGVALFRIDLAERDKVWWDGYNGEKWLLLDEFEGQMDRVRFNKLCGGYGHLQRWPIKGGFTNIFFTKIFITSNKNPEDWYPFLDNLQKGAVMRRLTKITKWE